MVFLFLMRGETYLKDIQFMSRKDLIQYKAQREKEQAILNKQKNFEKADQEFWESVISWMLANYSFKLHNKKDKSIVILGAWQAIDIVTGLKYIAYKDYIGIKEALETLTNTRSRALGIFRSQYPDIYFLTNNLNSVSKHQKNHTINIVNSKTEKIKTESIQARSNADSLGVDANSSIEELREKALTLNFGRFNNDI